MLQCPPTWQYNLYNEHSHCAKLIQVVWLVSLCKRSWIYKKWDFHLGLDYSRKHTVMGFQTESGLMGSCCMYKESVMTIFMIFIDYIRNCNVQGQQLHVNVKKYLIIIERGSDTYSWYTLIVISTFNYYFDWCFFATLSQYSNIYCTKPTIISPYNVRMCSVEILAFSSWLCRQVRTRQTNVVSRINFSQYISEMYLNYVDQ